MLRNAIFSVCLTTFYLVVYCTFTQFEITEIYAIIMFTLSPLLICWMVYTILTDGPYTGRELGDDEYGYQDKEKDELGIF